jgi:tape measure domain-containing protein
MARSIQAFALKATIAVDNAKGSAALKQTEKEVDAIGQRFQKLGPEITKSMAGAERAGAGFGKSFSNSATAVIQGSFQNMGQTLGSLIGTAVAPGIGTAIGSTIGSAVDTAFGKAAGVVQELIGRGMDLNRQLEVAKVHFTAFYGSEKEAVAELENLKKLSTTSGLDMRVLIEGAHRLEEYTDDLKLTDVVLKAATDQSAKFGSGVEGFNSIADALGLITERGELTSKMMLKLYKQGIDVPKLLAEATGKSEAYVKQAIAKGRINAAAAARMVSEGIERESGGYAAYIGQTTTYGREQVAGALTTTRAAEGTQNLMRAQRDLLGVEIKALQSETAGQLTKFIDDTTGKMLDMIERATKSGVRVVGGLAEGILSGDSMTTLKGAFSTLSGSAVDLLKGAFQIQSPSELTAKQVGEPMGEGLGVGMVRKFRGFMQGQGAVEIRQTLEDLLKDPKIQALLGTIQWAEGGALNKIVGGRTVPLSSAHPNIVGMRTSKGPSTAAGNYQITGTNWRRLQGQLGPLDFSSARDQAIAALAIMTGHSGGMAALQSGDPARMRALAAKDWTSTPGSTIGGGGQKGAGSWFSHFNQLAGGTAIDMSNPMPVRVVQDIGGGAADYLRQGREMNRLFVGPGQSWGGPGAGVEPAQDRTVQLGIEDAAVVNITDHTRELIAVDHERDMQLADMGVLIPRAVAATGTAALGAFHAISDTGTELNSETQKANAAVLYKGMGIVNELMGALGQVSGMIPGQQQVGKKRGLFSKILGFAAPFLSFIPGVGPILSQIAGMASAGLAGNWGGVVSGLATGLQTGGVFRFGSGSSTGSSHSSSGHGRALGGPVRLGQAYRVGERGEETFIPDQNGQIIPHGGGGGGALQATLDRLHAVMDRFESMPADHVVMKGAHGLMRAMDYNANISEQMGRRLRLA